MQKIYAQNHAPIDFYFSQNSRDFMVREVPLYSFSSQGEHLIINARKKGLNTLEMIKIFSNVLGCKASEIGYAGLKDKAATTTQYLSINKIFTKDIEKKLPLLEENNIKILSTTYHNNKIKIGHLKGNYFFIRLKKILPQTFNKIDFVLQNINAEGLPNYFGYQRFGKNGNNYLEGKKISYKDIKLKDKRINNFLISSYQSFLFNQWLSLRVKIAKIFNNFTSTQINQALKLEGISLELEKIKVIKDQPHFFKLFEGDVMSHYPYGKAFILEVLEKAEHSSQKRFMERFITPTGLLSGQKTIRAKTNAWEFEKSFDDSYVRANGSRRFGWIWLEELNYRYVRENAWLELEFFLPKGSYATTLIEELAHKEVRVD